EDQCTGGRLVPGAPGSLRRATGPAGPSEIDLLEERAETLTAASARTEHDAGGDPAIPHERDPHRSGPLRVLDENEVPDHVPAACMHGSLAVLRRSAHGDLVRLPQERLELRAAALVLDPGHGSQPCLGPWIGPRARREVGPHPFAQVPGL